MSGISLHVEVEGAGPPLLLIHGGNEDASGFDALAGLLAGDFTVCRYDRRGTSRSEPGPGWPRIGPGRHADDAAGLLERLDLAPATCYGGSSGAVVALALAARHPDAVSRVIAFEPPLLHLGPHGATASEGLLRLVRVALQESGGDYQAACEAFSRAIDGGAWQPGQELPNAEVFIEDDLTLLMAYRPELERLAAGPVPVTIAAGIWSLALLGEVASRIAATLGGQVEWLSSGHGVHRDEPEQLAGLVRRQAGQPR